ncbi:MAG: FAD-binding oxidoreductase [Methyloligellaceae bacterium]
MTAEAKNKRTKHSSQLLDRFTDIVGAANAIRDAAEMDAYLTELRQRYVGKTPIVLRPGSTQEVSEILKLAHETGTAIVPQGGNTGLVGGQIPFENGEEIVVSLSRMNAIRAIDPEGNTMTADAGVILEQAQAAADQVGRLFPLSLASEGSCQIGGNLATNAGGTAMLAYGNARDMVLGLEVVLADGRIWDGLRALRKDNTGYDLKHLFIGSEGTLGIITGAVLKLFPKPEEHATAFAGLASVEDAARFFSLARHAAGGELTAFEIMPRFGIELVIKHGAQVRDPLDAAHDWYVLIEVSGHVATGASNDCLEGLLGEALKEKIVRDAVLAASLAQRDDFWRLREIMSEVQGLEGGSIKHDVSVPIARIPEFINRANDLVQVMAPGARPVPFGHYGDGNIHYNVSQPVEMDKAAFLAQWDAIAAGVYEIVLDLDGSISAEHGIGRMKRDMLQRIKSEVELDMMRNIKTVFDPKGILNPGKVI